MHLESRLNDKLNRVRERRVTDTDGSDLNVKTFVVKQGFLESKYCFTATVKLITAIASVTNEQVMYTVWIHWTKR